ncbi:MAG TPA: hypothetical protein VHD31_02640 [Candidatus Paceibacterota bacterium]|nr:hypothetical protein [Candidatus Paceibacterota bacterium]
MVPHNDRSIRSIPVGSRGRKREPVIELEDDTPVDPMDMREQRPMMRRAPRRNRRWFIIIAVVVVILCAIGGLLLSTLFAGATVTVYPRQEKITPPSTLTAKLHPGAGELGYQVMTINRSATTTVQASGTKQVSRSASGPITIYNGAGTDAQRLIANTRFEAPDGKIYRIHESVSVPGGTKAADGTITPGSVTAMVYADSPGDSYNRAETRFTIPGFKGDPKYTTVYAQASAISGGFVGTEPSVAAADLSKASDTLKQGLTQAAQSALSSQIPNGYMAIPGTLQVTFSDLAQSPGSGNTANISQSATMSGSIVETNALASALARATITGYNNEAVTFTNVSDISIASATTTQPGADVPLQISGAPTLVWQFDPGAVKAALVGKSKSTFQSIIESFAPAIKRAEAKVRPFWEGNFPSNPDKIEVITGTQ